MTLVVDANVAVRECIRRVNPFSGFGAEGLIAPDFMRWETLSALCEYAWRIEARRLVPGMVTTEREDVPVARRRFAAAPIRIVPTTPALIDEAWLVAERCGFARIYDAIYVALARLEGAALVTLDEALRNGPAARLARIVGPTELL